jgi:hypothetical protein
LLSLTDTSFWEYDIMADSWSRIASQNKPDLSGQGCYGFQAPIDDYGVIMFVNHTNNNQRNVYLYKHGSSAGTVANAAETKKMPVSISVMPNPISSSARISAANLGNPSSLKAGIYNLRGELIRDLMPEKDKLAAGISLRTENQPDGIYFLKLQIGNRIYVQRFIIAR